jgi:hypothetical protein
LIPGADPAELVRELTRLVGDPAVEVRLANPNARAAATAPSPETTDLFRALEKSARHPVAP